MAFVDNLTPKNTEEIKPGLFIQKTKGGFRLVNPVAWKGKYRWKEQLKTVVSLKTIFSMAVILLLVWSYVNDTREYRQFYEKIIANPIAYCSEIQTTLSGDICTEQNERLGLCSNAYKDLRSLNITYGNTNNVSGNV